MYQPSLSTIAAFRCAGSKPSIKALAMIFSGQEFPKMFETVMAVRMMALKLTLISKTNLRQLESPESDLGF